MSALHCAAIAAKLTRVGSGPGAYPVASVLYRSVLYVRTGYAHQPQDWTACAVYTTDGPRRGQLAPRAQHTVGTPYAHQPLSPSVCRTYTVGIP